MIKKTLAALLAFGAATAAQAANFSYTGNLSDPNQVLRFDFSLTSPSDVLLRSYSYAGGVNAAGQTIARGGFDPILSLFNTGTGELVDNNDDADTDIVPADIDGLRYDVYLPVAGLAVGNYTALLTQYNNFPASLNGPFSGVSSQFTDFRNTRGEVRTSFWAFDILGVNTASCAPNCSGGGGGGGGGGGDGGSGTVPAPGGLALVLLGGALLSLRRVTARR